MTKLTVEDVKTIVWRYTFAYYNTKRVTTVNPDGLPPLVYRKTAAKKNAAKIHLGYLGTELLLTIPKR